MQFTHWRALSIQCGNKVLTIYPDGGFINGWNLSHVGNNNKPLNGIFHDELIQYVLEIAKECGYEATITGLFAAQNQERKLPGVSVISELERQYGAKAVEIHILRRLFVNIRLTKEKEQANGKYETCLAIAYHQRGIQVGFGTNVVYCHNQMLLNAECYVTTYTDEYAFVPRVYTPRQKECIDPLSQYTPLGG